MFVYVFEFQDQLAKCVYCSWVLLICEVTLAKRTGTWSNSCCFQGISMPQYASCEFLKMSRWQVDLHAWSNRRTSQSHVFTSDASSIVHLRAHFCRQETTQMTPIFSFDPTSSEAFAQLHRWSHGETGANLNNKHTLSIPKYSKHVCRFLPTNIIVQSSIKHAFRIFSHDSSLWLGTMLSVCCSSFFFGQESCDIYISLDRVLLSLCHNVVFSKSFTPFLRLAWHILWLVIVVHSFYKFASLCFLLSLSAGFLALGMPLGMCSLILEDTARCWLHVAFLEFQHNKCS